MQRGFIGSLGRLVGVLTVTALVLLARAPIVEAISDAEQSFLAMYFTEEELHVVSATRSLQSIERIAENIEVVTAADIELMNAHTLADVLNTVSGVIVRAPGTFGARTQADIQGAGGGRVTVLMNGVPLAFASANIAEVGFIPVHDIEKIEIVKGPASSAWGSALGGVVNVITKGPGSKPFQGNASISYGAKNSADYHAGVSGRAGRLGYYLSGSGLRTDGLTEGFDADAGHLGTSLSYGLGERATATFNLFYGDGDRGDGTSTSDDLEFSVRSKRLVSDLSLATAIGSEGHLALSVWTTHYDQRFRMGQISDGADLFVGDSEHRRTGGALRYNWTRGVQELVLGADYSRGSFTDSELPGMEPSLTQWAIYVNDTIGLGPLAITPGIRYDNTSTSEDFWSPSLGATYAISRSVLARATVARGFSIPSLESTSVTSEGALYKANPDLSVEKVWSYQAGVEADISNLFWLKLVAFRHDLDDAIDVRFLEDPPDWWTLENMGRQRRQGVEAAVKTMPFCHLTLAANAFFMETEDLDTGEETIDVPKRIFDLSLKYDDERSFKWLLRGRFLDMEEAEDFGADFGGFVFDLSLAKKLAGGPRLSVEAFLAIHNLFNGSQYVSSGSRNPERWAEGGLRASF